MRKTLAIVFVVLAFASSAYATVVAGVISSYRAPQAPNAPTGVTATAGDTQNTVSWAAPAVDSGHDAATSYTLYGGTSASPTTSIYSGSATSYTHTGLAGGTTYYYRVTASNAGGTSGYSSPDTTATPFGYSFEAGVLSPYTAGGTTAISTTYAHTGSNAVLVPGIGSAGNASSLSRATTLPASGNITISRWFLIHGTMASNGYAAIYSMTNDATASTWLSSSFIYFGSASGNGLSGGANGEGLYSFGSGLSPAATWIGTLAKDTWYKLVVNLDVTNSKRSFGIYNSAGSLVYGNLATYTVGDNPTVYGGTYPNLSHYDNAYTSSAGTAFGLYLDDINTGGL